MNERADWASVASDKRHDASSKRNDLIFIGIEFLEVIVTEITPTIVGGLLGGQRQRSLVLIEQHLEKRVAVFRTLTIEDKLYVATHREGTIVHPAFLRQLVQIVGHHSKAIDVEQTNQGHHHRLVAKAQMHIGLGQLCR